MTTTAVPRPRPRIASMAGPTRDRTRAAIVALVWHARDHISIAARSTEKGSKEGEFIAASERLLAALPMLGSADHLLEDALDASAARFEVSDLLSRAQIATRAAVAHGEIAASYVRGGLTEADERHAPRMILIFNKSAESAVRETQRALAALAEAMPDAYETEEL